ncbi:MAG TPA: hypothetical protein VIW24_25340 [Aldersonia sp.]
MSRVELRSDRVAALVAAERRSAVALEDCAGRMMHLAGCARLAAEVQAWAERTADLADRIAVATQRTVAADVDTADRLDRS